MLHVGVLLIEIPFPGSWVPAALPGADEEVKEQHGQGCVWNHGNLEWFWREGN